VHLSTGRKYAAEILDVARTHQFVIARRNNGWEIVETSELKQAKSEIKRLNDELAKSGISLDNGHAEHGVEHKAAYGPRFVTAKLYSPR
jgi:hypothetical protein